MLNKKCTIEESFSSCDLSKSHYRICCACDQLSCTRSSIIPSNWTRPFAVAGYLDGVVCLCLIDSSPQQCNPCRRCRRQFDHMGRCNYHLWLNYIYGICAFSYEPLTLIIICCISNEYKSDILCGINSNFKSEFDAMTIVHHRLLLHQLNFQGM